MHAHQKPKSDDFEAALKFFLAEMRFRNWIKAHACMLARFESDVCGHVSQHCHDKGYVYMDRGRVVLSKRGMGL